MPNPRARRLSEQIKVIRTPYCAPNANAYAERWVRTVREECLRRILILNEAHLRRVMREYVAYYTDERPCQGAFWFFVAKEPIRRQGEIPVT